MGTLRIALPGRSAADARALAALVRAGAAAAPSAGVAGGGRVVLVRRARVHLPVSASSADAVAVQAGRALEGALRDALRRPRAADDVLVFDSTAEYVAHFIEELAAGRTVDVWYFSPLLACRGRGLGETLANLARAEPEAWPHVLRILRRRGLLGALLARLGGPDRDLLRGVPAPPARPLEHAEGWPLFVAAWAAARAALHADPVDGPPSAPPAGARPAPMRGTAEAAFERYLDTHPPAPESWGDAEALGECVAEMLRWLLDTAAPIDVSAAEAALADQPWIAPAPARRVLRELSRAAKAARARRASAGPAPATYRGEPPAADRHEPPERTEAPPPRPRGDSSAAPEPAAGRDASSIHRIEAPDDAQRGARDPSSATDVGEEARGSSAIDGLARPTTHRLPAPGDAPAGSAARAGMPPRRPNDPSTTADADEEARGSSTIDGISVPAGERPGPAGRADPPPRRADDAPLAAEDGEEPRGSSAAEGMVAPAGARRGSPDRAGMPATRRNDASLDAPEAEAAGESTSAEPGDDEAAPAPRPRAAGASINRTQALRYLHAARLLASPRTPPPFAGVSSDDPLLEYEDEVWTIDAAAARLAALAPAPAVERVLALLDDAADARPPASPALPDRPIATVAAAARQMEDAERRDLARALSTLARSRPSLLDTRAAGLFFLLRPLLDLGVPGLATRAGIPGPALRSLLHEAALRAADAPRGDPAPELFAWGWLRGEWDEQPPLDEDDPRRAELAAALRTMAARHGVALAEAEGAEDLPGLLIEAGCRQMMRWLRGFESSSVAYTLARFVRRPGAVHVPAAGALEVRWPASGFDVLLERAGYLDPLGSVAWWDQRGVRWQR